jgi:hypothetical protein
MPGAEGTSPAAGVPGTESSDHDVPPQQWPGRDDFPPPANRAPGNVYPSSSAPAHSAPEHQQPPAIPPPDEEPALEEEPAPAADSYGTWARRERASAGTIYGGKDGASASAGPAVGGGSPLENSGSLTGHILSQGTAESDDDDDDEAPVRSGNRRVIIIIAVIIVVLIGGGYLAMTLAQNFIDGIFGGLTTPKK